jgi:hypothetical protein
MQRGKLEGSMGEGETYLGDAVFASFDGHQIRLRTGDANNQIIFLEPDVFYALLSYAQRLGLVGQVP